LHTVIILVNTLLTRIFLPPWHNESSVGAHSSALDANSAAKIRFSLEMHKRFKGKSALAADFIENVKQ